MRKREPEFKWTVPVSWEDSKGITWEEIRMSAGSVPDQAYRDEIKEAWDLLGVPDGGSPALVLFDEYGQPTINLDFYDDGTTRQGQQFL